MQKYTVIWRGRCDEFMFTVVETTDDPEDVPAVGWAQTAAAIEWADWDNVDRIAAMADLLTRGFDLLAVVKGELEYVA
jgi:hypothetical protein